MNHLVVLLAVAAALLPTIPALAANDAGASPFGSGELLYRVRTVRPEDIPVPPVEELPPPALGAPSQAPVEPGLRFSIRSFEVSGNTLLPLARIEEVLAPFRGEGKQISDVQSARDTLQTVYD